MRKKPSTERNGTPDDEMGKSAGTVIPAKASRDPERKGRKHAQEPTWGKAPAAQNAGAVQRRNGRARGEGGNDAQGRSGLGTISHPPGNGLGRPAFGWGNHGRVSQRRTG